MRAYRSLQALLAALFAVYLLLAVVEVASGNKGLVFPVSSWALFATVPNRSVQYIVRVRGHDGQTLDPPRDLLEMRWSMPGATRAELGEVIEALGAALAAHDEARIAAARRMLEHLYLHGREVFYEVEARAYDDPLNRWRGRPPVDTRILGVFATAGSDR